MNTNDQDQEPEYDQESNTQADGPNCPECRHNADGVCAWGIGDVC